MTNTVAIDFGTSNTVVSILEADTNNPKTIRLGSLSRLFKTTSGESDIPVIPTLVFIKDNNQILLGDQVRSQRLGQSQP
ncbi:MAG: Hsp70 family protein, partial [Coleofasciculus sp. C2-GNP5-27]